MRLEIRKPRKSFVNAFFVIFALGLTFSWRVGSAQTDSLISVLEKTKGYQERSTLLKEIVSSPRTLGQDAILYAHIGLKEAIEENNKRNEFIFTQSLARRFQLLHDSSYVYRLKAIALAKELGDSVQLGISYLDLAVLLESGIVMTGRENEHTVNPEALYYADSAVRIHKALTDTFNLIYAMNRKAEILMYLGRMKGSKSVLDDVGRLYARFNVPDERIDLGVNTEYYLKNQQYDSALISALRMLRISDGSGDYPRIAYLYALVSKIYSEVGEHRLAVKNGYRALEITEAHNLGKERIDALHALSIAHESNSDFKNALKYRKILYAYTDSLTSIRQREQINAYDLQLRDERNKAKIEILTRDQEIREAKAKRQRTIQYSLLGALILVSLLAVLWFNRLKLKQRALTHSRAQNSIIEKEKERSDSLLLNILPAEVAEELKEFGESDAREFGTVTILFTDFKEFTQTTEKLTAKELVEEINVCFKVFDSICEKYKIEKIKTIGDSYMAAGGLPKPSDHSVKDTVLAGIEMANFIIERKAEREAQGTIPFEMRVGINTGPVVAGIVGVKKFQYDIWGDTVNTASRMESTSEIGKVNISESTYQLLKDDPEFIFEPRGEVEAKGKGLVKMFFVSLR